MKTWNRTAAICIAIVSSLIFARSEVAADGVVTDSVWNTQATTFRYAQVTDLIDVPFHFAAKDIPDSSSAQSPVSTGETTFTQTPFGGNWNLYSHTTMSDGVPSSVAGEAEISQTAQSLYFSPESADGGVVWGVGPALTATGPAASLAGEGWGAGPSGMVMARWGRWSGGAMAKHIWSVDGDGSSGTETYVQPFLSYTSGGAWTYMLNTESSYDWDNDQWSVPIDALISKRLSLGGQPLRFGAGVRYWADSPEGGPDGLGFRAFGILRFH